MQDSAILLVVHKGHHSLGYYDPASGAELACVPVDPYPHEFALSPDRRFAYLCQFGVALAEDAGPGGNRVAVVDVAARARTAWLDCGRFRRPHGIAVDARARVYVLSEMHSELLCFEHGRLVRHTPSGGDGSHFVSVSDNGQQAYCSNMKSGTLSVVFPHAKRAAEVLRVGDRPEGSVLNADGSRLYVTNRESAEISVIDTRALKVLPPIATDAGPVRICSANDATLLVALYHAAALAIVDPAKPDGQTVVSLPGRPISVSFDAPSQTAYLSVLGADVCAVHVPSATVTHRIATRADPDPTAVIRA